MRNRFLRSLSLAVVLAAVMRPAPAQELTFTASREQLVIPGSLCAVLRDGTGTSIEISSMGTVSAVTCHGRDAVCNEAFSAHVGGRFAIGAINWTGLNLLPSDTGGPSHLCQPFYFPGPGKAPIFLRPENGEDSVYDLDDIYGDHSGISVPLGALVQVVIDNKPTNGQCLGVRTTVQHRKGTCQIWKIRKFYNTCREALTLTQVKEFELPCTTGTFAPQAGPSRSRTAVAATDAGEFVTLAAGDNLGGRPIAGSTPSFSILLATMKRLLGELTAGGVPLLVTEPKAGDRYLEVSLGFLPGGVTLKPAGTAGSEKIVDFHVEVQ